MRGRQVSSQDIYTSQTPVNYEKGDPRISKLNVNVRADRATLNTANVLGRRSMGRGRKLKGKRTREETQDDRM